MNYDWIWKAVDRIVRRHGTTDPIKLAQACNYYPLFDSAMKAWGRFIRVGKRDGAIYLSTRLKKQKLVFVAGHELGHGVLGHPTSIFEDERILCVRWFQMTNEEQEANLFAAHLLCRDYDWSHGNLQLAVQETGIPYQVLEQYILARGIDMLMKRNKRKKKKAVAKVQQKKRYYG